MLFTDLFSPWLVCKAHTFLYIGLVIVITHNMTFNHAMQDFALFAVFCSDTSSFDGSNIKLTAQCLLPKCSSCDVSAGPVPPHFQGQCHYGDCPLNSYADLCQAAVCGRSNCAENRQWDSISRTNHRLLLTYMYFPKSQHHSVSLMRYRVISSGSW